VWGGGCTPCRLVTASRRVRTMGRHRARNARRAVCSRSASPRREIACRATSALPAACGWREEHPTGSATPQSQRRALSHSDRRAPGPGRSWPSGAACASPPTDGGTPGGASHKRASPAELSPRVGASASPPIRRCKDRTRSDSQHETRRARSALPPPRSHSAEAGGQGQSPLPVRCGARGTRRCGASRQFSLPTGHSLLRAGATPPALFPPGKTPAGHRQSHRGRLPSRGASQGSSSMRTFPPGVVTFTSTVGLCSIRSCMRRPRGGMSSRARNVQGQPRGA